MVQIAFIVAGLAFAGAVASWVVGAVHYIRTLREISGSGQRALIWRAVLAWPAAVGRLRGAAAGHAARVNKALVSFMVCLIVAASAISVATNLARVTR